MPRWPSLRYGPRCVHCGVDRLMRSRLAYRRAATFRAVSLADLSCGEGDCHRDLISDNLDSASATKLVKWTGQPSGRWVGRVSRILGVFRC